MMQLFPQKASAGLGTVKFGMIRIDDVRPGVPLVHDETGDVFSPLEVAAKVVLTDGMTWSGGERNVLVRGAYATRGGGVETRDVILLFDQHGQNHDWSKWVHPDRVGD